MGIGDDEAITVPDGACAYTLSIADLHEAFVHMVDAVGESIIEFLDEVCHEESLV
jgi:hypothetical protein